MMKYFLASVLLAGALCAQPPAPSSPRTVVADTLLDFSCQNFSGYVYAILNSSDYSYARTVAVSNGGLSISLYPGTYSVRMSSTIFGVGRYESWTVPQSASPLTLSDVGSPSTNISCVGGVEVATFASPPSSPVLDRAYLFKDASATGTCTGGGTSYAICVWNGAAYVASSGTVTSAIIAGTTRQITVAGTCTFVTTGTCTLSLPLGLLLLAGTTDLPSLNIPSGSAVTKSVAGDIWNLSGVLQFHNGTAVKSIAFMDSNITGNAATVTNGVVATSPGVGIAHFAGSTQTVTSSAVNLAGGANEVSGVLPQANHPTTTLTQKFFGTATPGSVTGNLPGDLYTDTTNHNEYVCNAPSGTVTPACTTVATAEWMLINGGSGGISACGASPPASGSANAYCYDTSNILWKCSNGASACTTTSQWTVQMGKMFRLCSGAVVAHTLVKDTAANTVGPLTSDTEKVRGIAENACTNPGDPVIVTINGVTTLAKTTGAGTAVTDLHYIGPDVGSPTLGVDMGTALIGLISYTARLCCKAVAAASTSDATVLVDVLEVRFGAGQPCHVIAEFTGADIVSGAHAQYNYPTPGCVLDHFSISSDATITATFDITQVAEASWTGTGSGTDMVGSGTKPVVSAGTKVASTAIATGGSGYTGWTSVTVGTNYIVEVLLSSVTVGSATMLTITFAGTR